MMPGFRLGIRLSAILKMAMDEATILTVSCIAISQLNVWRRKTGTTT